MERLDNMERATALHICSEIERGGLCIRHIRFTHPKHGLVLACAENGVLVLMKEKRYGPKTYLAFGAGRYFRSDNGSVVVQFV
jgi:hypothetical protein